jgi:hypothetical protein
MPCNDVTELLELTLDADDRVRAYSLAKNTCGAPVASRLELTSFIAGRHIDELTDRTLMQIVESAGGGEAAPPPRIKFLDEFMLQKQLGALQRALAVYRGAEPGGKDDAFAMASIDFDGLETRIVGLLRVDLLTAEIEACGGCSSCS